MDKYKCPEDDEMMFDAKEELKEHAKMEHGKEMTEEELDEAKMEESEEGEKTEE